MKFLCVSVLIFLVFTYVKSSDFQQRLEKEITNYVTTGESDGLKKVIAEIYEAPSNSFEENADCMSCNVVANAAINLRKSGGDDRAFENFLKTMCQIFEYTADKSCSGLIDASLNSWLYMLDNTNITSERICSIRLQKRNCRNPDYTPWHINIPEGESKKLPKKSTGKVLKVLQLTDIHYDPLYEPGSNANCKESICCEASSGKPEHPNEAAGYWGDYAMCDIPWYTIENAMKHITDRHPDIDRVYFTGDIISHQSWITNAKDNSKTIKKLLKFVKETFGTIPFYPILGNHEPHPVDLFPPLDVKEDISMQWLYDLLGEEWTQWLPKETKSTIHKGGYYTTLIKPGVRIIGINSNVCFTNNAWLIYDDRDPLGQLQWLADTLLEAEKNGEAVHLLSHVPSGEKECHKQWAHEFKRIIERFHGIITGQFNGHTHYDELKVFYDPKNSEQVIHVANNGGSLTTFSPVNPSYKIYYVEEEQNRIVDHETWAFDLGEANKYKTEPKWFKLYSFKEDFGLDDLDEDSYHKLLKRMSTDTKLMERYERFRTRNSSVSVKDHYDKQYLDELLCDITSVEYTYPEECMHRFHPITEKSDL